MKLRIVILLLPILILSAYSQNPDFDEIMTPGSGYTPQQSPYLLSGNWENFSNSPMSVSRSCCAYVEINGVPYLYQFGGGNVSSELKRVARLNLQTNSWQNNYSTMPTQISSGTAIPMNGGTTIYVFGGNNFPGSLGKTLKYNVLSNSWETLSDMPSRITDALVVKYDESRIILVGGGDGYFGSNALKINKVQIYNINSNSYSYSNDFPIQNTMLGGGIYRDTIITVGGYTTGGVATENCYKGVIDPSNMQINWTTIPSYPGGPISRMASFVAVKNTGVGIVVTGGAIGGTVPTSQTNFWNFCTQSWQPGLPDNSVARSNYKACGEGYDIIYMTAGYTNTGVGTTEAITFYQIDGPCTNMVGFNETGNNIPDKYELRQNYPNPFNPVTKILFSIPTGGNVKISIYDSQGREIKELVNGIYNAGVHKADFNAAEYPSGVYFYTLYSGPFKETKKMLLIK